MWKEREREEGKEKSKYSASTIKSTFIRRLTQIGPDFYYAI